MGHVYYNTSLLMPAKKPNATDATLILTKEVNDFTKEVNEFSKEVSRLKDLEFMKVFTHPWKFMWFSFLKGLMIGFGSVLGASVLVGIFIYILAQIRLVPILGDLVQDVIDQIQTEQQIIPGQNGIIPPTESPVETTKTISK